MVYLWQSTASPNAELQDLEDEISHIKYKDIFSNYFLRQKMRELKKQYYENKLLKLEGAFWGTILGFPEETDFYKEDNKIIIDFRNCLFLYSKLYTEIGQELVKIEREAILLVDEDFQTILRKLEQISRILMFMEKVYLEAMNYYNDERYRLQQTYKYNYTHTYDDIEIMADKKFVRKLIKYTIR